MKQTTYIQSFDLHQARQAALAGKFQIGQYVKIAGKTARYAGVYRGEIITAKGETLAEINQRFARILNAYGFKR